MRRGQLSTLVAHWLRFQWTVVYILLVENNFPLPFLSCDLMIAIYLRIYPQKDILDVNKNIYS